MIHESLSDRLAQKLESAYCHWDMYRRSSSPNAFTVAISREAGTHGTTVAEEVGRRLKWQVYDHQLLNVVAENMGVQKKLLESVDEKQTSWLSEVFRRACAVPMVSEPAYVHHLTRTLLALSVHGDCVIVGRGAAQILPEANTLRVRLVAPMESRIAAIARERAVSLDEAKRFVETADQQHVTFIRDHFHKDPTNPEQYDLVLNAARFSVTECAELIIQCLHELQAKTKTPVLHS